MRFVKMFAVLMFFSVLFAACSQSSEKNKPVALGEEKSLAFVNERLHFSSEVEGACLFQESSGDNDSRVPGPTDYTVFGTITLSPDIMDEYMKDFAWHSWDDETRLKYENMMRESGEDPSLSWKYSEDFKSEVLPAYYDGAVFVCGNRIWIAAATM